MEAKQFIALMDNIRKAKNILKVDVKSTDNQLRAVFGKYDLPKPIISQLIKNRQWYPLVHNIKKEVNYESRTNQ